MGGRTSFEVEAGRAGTRVRGRCGVAWCGLVRSRQWQVSSVVGRTRLWCWPLLRLVRSCVWWEVTVSGLREGNAARALEGESFVSERILFVCACPFCPSPPPQPCGGEGVEWYRHVKENVMVSWAWGESIIVCDVLSKIYWWKWKHEVKCCGNCVFCY